MREGWEYKTFGEVGSFLRGKSIQKADFVEKGLPCIHYGQIHTKFGVSVDKHLSEIPLNVYNKSIIASYGDVIIAITSEDLDGSCKSTAWLGNYDIAVSSHAAVYKHNLCPLFIVYYMRSKSFYYEKQKYARGFKVMEIKTTDIAKIPIPVPPLSEQQRIVSELDLLSSIIEKKKSQLKEYDQLAQSIFYDMFGDPIENPKGWEVKKLGEVYKLKSGDGLSAKQFVNGLYPVYGGNGINGYHNSYNMDGNYIIIGRVGAYCGNVRNVIGKFWLTDNAFQLIYDVEQQHPIFVTYVLTYLDLHQYANHAAQPVISNIALKEIKVLFPPLPLQQSFAEKIESLEHQKSLIQQSIVETQTMFDYTMDKYFG